MKISINWLKDYIQTDLSAEKIADILSNLGLPFEGIEHSGDDAVIDVEVTSNRCDCLSYIGIARELAVFTGKPLKIPVVQLNESAKSVADFAKVEITEPDLCSRYTARVIEGVKIGPSPDWMVKRLEAVGMRSVNNVVDATNYAMLETGQPPHAFDYKKISGAKIIVRNARPGEHIVSIDGSKCVLEPNMLIIADSAGPVAIAGVMGGIDTEVNDTTATVLLEDAYFDPVSIRTTSRKLALSSEASFRFERIVDVEMVDWASQRTAQLIMQVAGGKLAKGVIDVYPKKPQHKQIVLRLDRLKKVLGIEIPNQRTLEILERLGFSPKQQGGSISCIVPSWRSDVYREADLVEEVARVYGYDKVPTENKIKIEVTPLDARQKILDSIQTYLNGCGFYETISVTFIDDSIAAPFVSNTDKSHLSVKDVSRKSTNLLRQTLLPSLFDVLKTNLNAKNKPCWIFEIADTFVPADDKGKYLPVEKNKLALAGDFDLRYLRGVIEGLVGNLNKEIVLKFESADLSWAQTGAKIFVDSKVLGFAGVASKVVIDKFDIKDTEICAAEIDFELLSSLQADTVKIKPLPRFPAIDRDLSLVIDESIIWEKIVAAINKKAIDKLESVKFVDLYKGKNIPAGKKSITLSLRFRDEDGTLTHEQVDVFEKAILADLTESVGAQLRTI